MSDSLDGSDNDELHTFLSAEIESLYQDFGNHELKYHYTSYFPQLKIYFIYGKNSIKNHAIELILSIILGGKWAQEGLASTSKFKENNRPEGMGTVQWKLLQIKKRKDKDQDPPTNNSGHSSNFSSSSQQGPVSIIEQLAEAKKIHWEINVNSILSWLEDTLPQETDEQVFSIFFIFVNTHWEHLKAVKPDVYQRLRDLHYKLMENVKYAKFGAFERLNMTYYSSTYRPIK